MQVEWMILMVCTCVARIDSLLATPYKWTINFCLILTKPMYQLWLRKCKVYKSKEQKNKSFRNNSDKKTFFLR